MFKFVSDKVFVTVESENGTQLVTTGYTVDGEWRIDSHIPGLTVTHWMPFPNLMPPKRLEMEGE